MTKEELKNRVLNGGRGSGQSLRLLCEVYENRIAELERKLEQTEKDLADYQFNYPKIKELEKENKTLEGCLLAEQEHTQILEKQIEKMKCFMNCNYSNNSSCLLNSEKKEECEGCQYWRLRKMKSKIEMKVNIDVKNHIKQLEELCEDWKSDHEHNLELMKGLNNRISELERENAELKAEIEKDRDLPAIAYMQGAEKQKKKDERQLTKAKEIIKNCVCIINRLSPTTALLDKNERNLLEQAEQFLKE